MLGEFLNMPRPWRIVLLVAALIASMWAFFSPDPGTPEGAPGVLDLVAHVLIFALLAALAVWCFGAGARVVAALLAYAVVTEVVQLLLDNGRSASALDALADVAGIALTLTLWKRDRQPSQIRG
jgi:VanZ family protein